MDTLFPPSPETLLVRKLHVRDLLEICHTRDVDGVRVLLPFSNERVRACIHEAKFAHNIRAQKLLGAVLAKNLPAEDLQIIVPIPLSRKRQYERGYNQVTEIARHARTRMPGYFLHTNILSRTKHTTPQTELGKAERKKNITGVFHLSVRNARKIKGRHILLLDDVMTTGATLHEAQKELKRANPASITCIALAH